MKKNSTNEYNTCKRDAYLNYLKKKLSEEVKKEGKDYINKMKSRINQLNHPKDAPEYREYWEEIYTQQNKEIHREPGIKFENDTFSLDEKGIKNYIENYIRERQSHHASKHNGINTDDITINQENQEQIFNELKQFIQTRQF